MKHESTSFLNYFSNEYNSKMFCLIGGAYSESSLFVICAALEFDYVTLVLGCLVVGFVTAI